MPFAKTLEVYGTDKKSASFPLSNYLVSVDPSAYYTVIFVQADIKPADPLTNPLSTINYSYFGNEEYLMYGYWMNLTLSLNDTLSLIEHSTQYKFNLTCFVAVNQSEIQGLRGVLGLAASNGVVQENFSALYILNKTYNLPIDFVSIYAVTDTLYNLQVGYISFSYN